jgi:hypothetical protein
MDVTFNVPDHGGAVILGARVLFPEDLYPYPHATMIHDWEAAHYATGHDEIGGWNYPDARGVLVTPSYVRISPGLHNWPEISTARHIDIQLLLSVEPGYTDKYGEKIDISLSGTSLSNSVTVTAAYVKDPVEVYVEPVEIPITNNTAFIREIDDIIIRETDFGALRQGEEIWVYVVGPRAGEIDFTADMIAKVNTGESGLRLTRGNVLRNRRSDSRISGGVRYTVEARSHEFGNNNAGEIIITGGRITGPVSPGAAYKVVISGPAIAANQYTVYENKPNADANTLIEARNISWRLFDSEAYEKDVFNWTNAINYGLVIPASERPANCNGEPTIADVVRLLEWLDPVRRPNVSINPPASIVAYDPTDPNRTEPTIADVVRLLEWLDPVRRPNVILGPPSQP